LLPKKKYLRANVRGNFSVTAFNPALSRLVSLQVIATVTAGPPISTHLQGDKLTVRDEQPPVCRGEIRGDGSC